MRPDQRKVRHEFNDILSGRSTALGPLRRTAGLRWASTETAAATMVLVSELGRDFHRTLLKALYRSIQAIDGGFGHRISQPITNNVCNFEG